MAGDEVGVGWEQLCSWSPEVTVWPLREFTMEPEDITFKARSQQSMCLRQATVHRTHNLSEQQHMLGPAVKHMSLWVRWFLFKLLHILWCSVPVKTAYFCYVNGEKITEPSIQEFDVNVVLTFVNMVKWYQVWGLGCLPLPSWSWGQSFRQTVTNWWSIPLLRNKTDPF